MHKAHIVHHIRGRIRLKFPGAKRELSHLQKIKEAISPMSGVRQVDVNSLTGSIVVTYDTNLHDAFQQQLSACADQSGLFKLQPPPTSEADQMAQRIEEEADFLSEHSETARSLVEFVKRINLAIRKTTDNSVDLKVLLPLALAAYSLVELESDISTPLWVTLGIFSFNSFVTLHHPHVDVDRRDLTSASCEEAGDTPPPDDGDEPNNPGPRPPASRRKPHAV
jgi:cation transport ATPase